MPNRNPRLLLADDHPMLLDGLRKLVEPIFDVVGMVHDGRTLIETALRQRPDLVITDIAMPGIDGIEATRRLCAIDPGMRVLIFSIHTEPSWVQAAFDAGARGYLAKSCVAEEIELAVREVLNDHYYVSPVVARAAVVRDGSVTTPTGRSRQSASSPPVIDERPAPDERLTPRELEIVNLVGQGMANKEIARRLGVAVTTVRTHLKSVYEKLDLDGRVALALHAAPRRDLVSSPATAAEQCDE